MKVQLSCQTFIPVIKEITHRMRDPDTLKQILLEADSFWEDLSMAEGYPAVLLLFAMLDRFFPGEGWDDAAHAYVLKIREVIETAGIVRASFYGGLSGVCFALQQASRGGIRYQRLLATLNAHLQKQVEMNYLLPLRDNLRKGQPSSPALYGLIQGVVGIGIYGLNNIFVPSFVQQTKSILRVLVNLTKPFEFENKTVPGWYVPPSMLSEEEKLRFPEGHARFGLVQGASGILAFLAIAFLRGVFVEGQKEAMAYLSSWLRDHRVEAGEVSFWPAAIAFDSNASPMDSEADIQPCYDSSLGIARSLFLAGRALRSSSLQEFALNAFRSLLLEGQTSWNAIGPTVRYGVAGLLLMTSQMAHEAKASDLNEKTLILNEALWDYYRPEVPFGFRSFNGYAQTDRAGLLDGVSGILLTLLDPKGLSYWWNAPFLIGDGS